MAVGMQWQVPMVSRRWEAEDGGRRGTIVAVHGVSGTSWDFHAVAPVWAEAGWRVLAPDLPGFGYSPWHPEARYRFTELADTLAEYLAGVGPGPIVYVGHSMAGRLGVWVAAHYPGRMARLVLVDAGPGAGPGSPRVRERVRSWPESGSRDALYEQYRGLYRAESDSVYEARMAEYLEPLGDGRARIRRDPRVKDHIFPAPVSEGGPDLWAAWGRVEVPVLLIRGGRSDMLTDEIVERMHGEHPGLKVEVLPGIGHNVPSEAPAELAEQVLAFLNQ